MAGSDKVDPAIPCFARHVCSPCLLASANANRRRGGGRGDDGFPGFQSLQKMLARGLDMNSFGHVLGSRRRLGVICKMRGLPP